MVRTVAATAAAAGRYAPAVAGRHVRRRGQQCAAPRGQGYGPAEVNLSRCWAVPIRPCSRATAPSRAATAGRRAAGRRHRRPTTAIRWLNWNRWFSYDENYWTGVTSDAHAAGRLGFAARPAGFRGGRPGPHRAAALYLHGRTLTNTPYDIDLSHYAPHATGSMTPRQPVLGERIRAGHLRPYDRDAGTLPPAWPS